jgi:hypothetical protein
MNKGRKIVVSTIWILFVGNIIILPLFAGQSITFSASCYMPQIITNTDGEMAVAENQDSVDQASIAQPQLNEEPAPIMQQQEEAAWENGQEIKFITVCAR